MSATLALFLLIGEAWDHLAFYLGHCNAADGAAMMASLRFQKRLGLETPTISALMHSRRRHATDLHDYVFGIAGIAKDLPITINYKVPVPILYQQLARNKILHDGNLDILSACYIFDSDMDIMTDHTTLARMTEI
ncbi:hypothetical protein L207DRAFT_582579 [Hyaloscypha variabilis F]|uniref:Uncharacterized protein n=1 Tax=Hyaloscypha variabilis (strain UAMH 11265 / GT02V1 / F) TaxID=1149755 RepID=A0A2J6RPD3_HYAVF|nr:hypothetical protein L207DRAFT_582579 [Hyaloscypha variabilis F]